MSISVQFLFTQDYITRVDGNDYPVTDLFHAKNPLEEVYHLDVLPRVGEVIHISCNGFHQFRVKEIVHNYLIKDEKSDTKLEYSYVLIILEPIPFSEWIHQAGYL